MTAWTTKQKADLNKMCSAAKNVTLGTFLSGLNDQLLYRGNHVVTSAEASAGSAPITTGATTLTGWMGNAFRSGSLASGWSATSAAGGVLVFRSGSSGSGTAYAMAENDVFNWIGF
jgi:hypothetical protein